MDARQTAEKLEQRLLELEKEVVRRRRAEESLRESEEKYRTIIESIEEGYFETDLKGRLIYMNHRLCEIMGYSPKELTGMSSREYMTAETAVKVNKIFNQVYQTETPAKTPNFEVVKKDGQHAVLELSTTLIKDRENRPAGFRGVARDITNRIKAEREKEKIEYQRQHIRKLETIKRLCAGMAHDFNTLLARVLGYIDLAKEDLKPGTEIYNFISAAEEQCAYARMLTEKFRTVSGELIPKMKIGSFGELLQYWTNAGLFLSNIKWKCIIADDLWPVEFDERLMKQVIDHIILNAGDAMTNGGQIAVLAENLTLAEKINEPGIYIKAGKYVKISIRDQGRGIPEADLSEIFDPYYSSKEIGDQKGMGLGLAMAYTIIKKHKGYIYVKSTVGVGTTIDLYIPAYEEG